jgi:hypothetical protein
LPGARFSFVNAMSASAYLRHAGFALFANDPSAIPADGTWDIVAGNNGEAGTISFRSVNYPDRFLRHAGFRCWLHRRDGSGLFDDDSTFRVVAGVCGDPQYISFQSVNFPTYYIFLKSQEVWIATAHDVRACWITKAPLA